VANQFTVFPLEQNNDWLSRGKALSQRVGAIPPDARNAEIISTLFIKC